MVIEFSLGAIFQRLVGISGTACSPALRAALFAPLLVDGTGGDFLGAIGAAAALFFALFDVFILSFVFFRSCGLRHTIGLLCVTGEATRARLTVAAANETEMSRTISGVRASATYGLYHAEQQQEDQYDQEQAECTAGVVSPISTVWISRNGSEDQHQQHNQQNQTQHRHCIPPWAVESDGSFMTRGASTRRVPAEDMARD